MTATTAPRADNIRLAVIIAVGMVLGLSLGDAVIKGISGGFPLWQIFVCRAVFAVPVLLAVMRRVASRPSIAPRSLTWTTIRSLMLVGNWIAYYAALPHVPLGSAAAVYYTGPLFITLCASLVLRERVGPKGWFAMVLGFAGVLLIVQPQGDAFTAWALSPLIAAVLYGGAMILTRSKCRGEHPLVLSLALNITFVIAGLAMALGLTFASETVRAEHVFLFGSWVTMGAHEWLVAAALAAAILIGSVGAAFAYQLAPASIVAAFDFCYLVFATGWGFIFFGEVPTGAALVGSALIAAGGLMAVLKR